MSKPKELNFFVEELSWDLGLDWYRGRFDDRFPVRGESSPHYTNLPYFTGVAERIAAHVPDAKLIYMVRDPISRILSHWRHAVGAGYETRPMEDSLARSDQTYVTRSRYWMQLQPYLEHFDRSQIEVITQEELQSDRNGTMRKAFSFAGVDPDFTSEQFEREWEKSTAKESERYQFMEKLIKLPGLRSFDRNFDRLPERMRWMVEKVVHDPDAPPAPKPELPTRSATPSFPSSARTWRRSSSSPAASSRAGRATPRTRRLHLRRLSPLSGATRRRLPGLG
jgi:hypothetical protein